ncbi:peptidase M16 domain protein [Denitrovibrio acetiphilus DSM 12809]|uniref:Peptidase M16 domain protein n=1 Tax=Denitrovibrio acetiphilus (strain DSM 12809 / NBRC 114555 / N2460) TaxID=522772 RepID=D4H6N3_DENA2|nr:M16 family metallopeptidase [Denitrovibrio acetiphilus]ADD67749.1 peptidase M16 domain protein [Denitrovibrio acetiphilus DSM 12809]
MITKNLKILILALLVAFTASCEKNNAQTAKYTSEPLPVRQDIVQGELDNGLKYYIMPNSYPDNTVELRLNVRTGSLNETDAESGLAHFVEHMAFNGTKHFPGNGVIDFMEEAGLTFGKHSNAYTSTNVTNYQLTIPLEKEGLFDKSFLILRDWADGLLFNPEEIEKEKGVIVEEWRMRNDYKTRLRNMRRDILLAGSKFPDRKPIGDMDVVKGATRELLKGYYDKWYTAENMSVIVVGDIDPVKAEELIKKGFSDMEKKSTPEAASQDVPLSDRFRFEVITDEEAPSLSFSINHLKKTKPLETYDDYKTHILEQGVTFMFNQRMSRKKLSGDTDLFAFRAGVGRIADTTKDYIFSSMLDEENYIQDMDEFFMEIERMKRFGFTVDEMKEFEKVMHQQLERYSREDKVFESANQARMIINFDTSGGDLMTPAQELAVFDKVTSEVNITSFNRKFQEMLDTKDRVVIVSVPEKLEGELNLDLQSVKDSMEAAAKADLKEMTSVSGKNSLMEEIPEPAKITAQQKIDLLEADMVKLENGATLYIHKSDLKKHEFEIMAIRPGGYSVLDDEEYMAASSLGSVINTSGFAGLDRNSISRILAGHKVSVDTKTTENYETFSGGGDSEDLELAFQLLNRYLTSFEVTDQSYSVAQESLKKRIDSDARNKFSVYMRSILTDLYNENYRRSYLEKGDLDKLDKDFFAGLYNKLYGDIDGYVFVISGDVDPAETAELFARYIGSIKPSGNIAERTQYKDRNVRFAAKSGNFIGQGDVEPKTTVIMRFENDVPDKEEYTVADTFASLVFKKQLRKEVREKLGGVYSITGFFRKDNFKEQYARGMVRFTCDPERTNELIAAVNQIINALPENGVSEADLTEAKEQFKLSIEDSKKRNSFWLKNIAYHVLFDQPVQSTEEYVKYIDSITVDDVNSFIRDFMKGNSEFVVRFEPEAK